MTTRQFLKHYENLRKRNSQTTSGKIVELYKKQGNASFLIY